MLDTLRQDARYALRQMRRSPGFAVVAILTLALGLGATTAIYSVVDGVLLRPLPYPHPDRLLRVWHLNTRNDAPREQVSFETYRGLVGGVDALDAAAGVSPRWSFVLREPGQPERVQGYWVSASFFDLMGVRPAIGRGFRPDEDRAEGPAVVLLGHALWERKFGGDPGVVGRSIRISGRAATVIGVMPAGFDFPDAGGVWAPLAQNPLVGRGRQVRWVDVVGRLAPGATVERARDGIAAYFGRLARAYPKANGGLRATVQTLYASIVGGVSPALWTLLGGVAFLLLITCANLSNLLLSRAAARRGELAVRRALGAGSGRLVRQLLTESVTLGLFGGAAGTAVAFGLVGVFRSIGPADLPRLEAVGIDLRVLGVAGGLTLAASVLFGLAPALTAAREGVQGALRRTRRGVAGGRSRLRSGLVVSQVTLALVLLAGAGLLLHSFVRLNRVDPGFRASGVLTLQFGLPSGYDDARAVDFYRRLFDRLEAIPGVTAAGGATRLPLGDALSTRLEIRGRDVPDGDQPDVQFRRASPDYFAAMGIPVLRGRGFDERDGPDAPPVMILSRAAAETFWPGEDPVGQRVRFWYSGMPADAPWLEVVGITGDVKEFGLDAAAPPVTYVPFSQGPPGSPFVAVHTTGDPSALAAPVRDRLRSLDPDIVIWNVSSMSARVSESVARQRFSLILIGAFGVLALVLAAVGIYGVLAYAVRRRSREIGIRMALGAAGGDVVRMVVSHGLRLTLVGLGLGLVAALLLTRLIRSLLFDVSPTDPLALGGVTIVLGAVAALASWLPARRATRVDPMTVLREE
ncbi:MAG TPA: ABC transporter permease [Gemmatimonadota bacterium]|nr:ABC transporter permease [Gemmatimonadota bacterium]